MQIDVAIVILRGLIAYFEKYREEGFQSAMTLAKELASKMEIDHIFLEKRKTQRKKQFDETCSEELHYLLRSLSGSIIFLLWWILLYYL